VADIDTQAVGDFGLASWATAVANMLNERSTQIDYVPTTTLSTSTSGYATWITIGNVTVPSWATQARVTWSIVNYGPSSTTALNVDVYAQLGDVTGNDFRLPGSGASGANSCFTVNDLFTDIDTGSQSLIIVSHFNAGSGTFQIGTSGLVSAAVDFLP